MRKWGALSGLSSGRGGLQDLLAPEGWAVAWASPFRPSVPLRAAPLCMGLSQGKPWGGPGVEVATRGQRAALTG